MTKTKKQIRKEEKHLTEQRKKMFGELFILGKSFLFWIIAVILFTFDANYWHTFSNIVVDITTGLLDVFGFLMFTSVEIISKQTGQIEMLDVYHATVTVAGYRMLVELECTAYHAFIAVIALVLFAGWNIKQKLIRGSIMILILLVMNNIRLVLLGIVGKHYPSLFNTFHDYVWNILLVLIVWIIWEKFNQLEIKKLQLNENK